MTEMTVALPESISEAEAKVCLAAKLFELGRLSCGQAAQLAGYSKRTFIELLGKQGIAVLDYPPEELTDDLVAADFRISDALVVDALQRAGE